MRTLVLFFCLLVPLSSAQRSYYPQADGLTWTYSNGETQVLSGPREVGGQNVMVLVHLFDGIPVSEDYLVYQEDGVYSLGTSAGGQTLFYDAALVIYDGARLQAGHAWSSSARIQNDGLELTLSVDVLGMRGVETPAGRYNALHVRQTTITSTGARTTLELYFVPTVGVVRFVTQDGETVDLVSKNF